MKESVIAAIKRRSLVVSLIYSIIILAIGFYFVMDTMPYVVAAFAGYLPFESLRPEEIKDQLTELDLQVCFGPYAEQYAENTSTHVQRITHYYYMLPTGGENDIDFRFMSIRVPVSFTEQMNRILDASAAGSYSESLHFTGRIYKLSQKEYSFFQDSLLSSGWTADEIETMTLPYCIDAFDPADEKRSKTKNSFHFCIGILLVLWSAWRIFRGLCGGNMQKFRRAYEAAGFTEAAVEADLIRAFPKTKNAQVRVGLLCLYYGLNGQRPALIPNKDIIWAYHVQSLPSSNRTRPDPNRQIAVYALNDKKPHLISIPDMTAARNVMKRISSTMPWVIIGYSAELEKMIRKDRSRFLQLRYNTVDHVTREPAPDAE